MLLTAGALTGTLMLVLAGVLASGGPASTSLTPASMPDLGEIARPSRLGAIESAPTGVRATEPSHRPLPRRDVGATPPPSASPSPSSRSPMRSSVRATVRPTTRPTTRPTVRRSSGPPSSAPHPSGTPEPLVKPTRSLTMTHAPDPNTASLLEGRPPSGTPAPSAEPTAVTTKQGKAGKRVPGQR